MLQCYIVTGGNMSTEIIIKPKTISEARDIKLLQRIGFDLEKGIKKYLHEQAKRIKEFINEKEIHHNAR